MPTFTIILSLTILEIPPVRIQIMVFWVVIVCTFVVGYQHISEEFRVEVYSILETTETTYQSTWCLNPHNHTMDSIIWHYTTYAGKNVTKKSQWIHTQAQAHAHAHTHTHTKDFLQYELALHHRVP
jgi:hypothetical protein